MSAAKPSEREKLIDALLLALASTRVFISPRAAIATALLANQDGETGTESSLYQVEARIRIGQARESLAEAERLLQRSDLTVWQRLVLMRFQGAAHYGTSNFDASAVVLEQCLQAARDYGDPSISVPVLSALGMAFLAAGNRERGERAIREAFDMIENLGSARASAVSHSHMSYLYQGRRDYAQAKEYSLRAIGLHREVGIREGETLNLSNYAQLCQTTKDFDEALACVNEAMALAQNARNTLEIARNTRLLGEIAIDRVRAKAVRLDECVPTTAEKAEVKRALDLLTEAELFYRQQRNLEANYSFMSYRVLGEYLLGNRDEARNQALSALALMPAEEQDRHARLHDYEDFLADVRAIAAWTQE